MDNGFFCSGFSRFSTSPLRFKIFTFLNLRLLGSSPAPFKNSSNTCCCSFSSMTCGIYFLFNSANLSTLLIKNTLLSNSSNSGMRVDITLLSFILCVSADGLCLLLFKSKSLIPSSVYSDFNAPVTKLFPATAFIKSKLTLLPLSAFSWSSNTLETFGSGCVPPACWFSSIPAYILS